jgi:hypothetical protein
MLYIVDEVIQLCSSPMKIKPISFAAHFNIDEQKLSELGIFNPVLNFDTKLFVEPLLLNKSASPFMHVAFENYNDFFRTLLVLIRASKEPGDKAWREAKRRINFPEYKATCIGYGSDSINGSGSGRELNEKILQSAKDIVEFAKNDPAIFQLLPLLEEGIGADIVSDMTQNIIDDDICQYTVDAMEKLGLQAELCKTELATRRYSSANQLCNKVAEIIEKEYPALLTTFEPYKNHASKGNDWKRPTFYEWCNDCFKGHKMNTCPA